MNSPFPVHVSRSPGDSRSHPIRHTEHHSEDRTEKLDAARMLHLCFLRGILDVRARSPVSVRFMGPDEPLIPSLPDQLCETRSSDRWECSAGIRSFLVLERSGDLPVTEL